MVMGLGLGRTGSDWVGLGRTGSDWVGLVGLGRTNGMSCLLQG